MDKAYVLRDGTDIGIIACGETVRHAMDAAIRLESEGISARVVDMYCIRPSTGRRYSGPPKGPGE